MISLSICHGRPQKLKGGVFLQRLHESTPVKQQKQSPPTPSALELQKPEQLKEIFHDVSRLHLF